MKKLGSILLRMRVLVLPNCCVSTLFFLPKANTIFTNASTIPGYAATQVEDREFLADRASSRPIVGIHGGPHFFVPFALEDGGRIGARALALLPAVVVTDIRTRIRIRLFLHTAPSHC